MIAMINRIAASCDRSLPPEQAVPLRVRQLIAELREHCINLDAMEDLLAELQEKETLLIAAIMSGGRIHDDLSVVFEGRADAL